MPTRDDKQAMIEAKIAEWSDWLDELFPGVPPGDDRERRAFVLEEMRRRDDTLRAQLAAAEKRTEAHRVEIRRLTDKIAALQESPSPITAPIEARALAHIKAADELVERLGAAKAEAEREATDARDKAAMWHDAWTTADKRATEAEARAREAEQQTDETGHALRLTHIAGERKAAAAREAGREEVLAAVQAAILGATRSCDEALGLVTQTLARFAAPSPKSTGPAMRRYPPGHEPTEAAPMGGTPEPVTCARWPKCDCITPGNCPDAPEPPAAPTEPDVRVRKLRELASHGIREMVERMTVLGALTADVADLLLAAAASLDGTTPAAAPLGAGPGDAQVDIATMLESMLDEDATPEVIEAVERAHIITPSNVITPTMNTVFAAAMALSMGRKLAAPSAPQAETPDEREAAIVLRLAGEWGEIEVGPTESIDDVVSHIHGAGSMIMRLVNETGDWSYWARKHLGSKEHRDPKLREALDKRLAPTPSAPQGGPPNGWARCKHDEFETLACADGVHLRAARREDGTVECWCDGPTDDDLGWRPVPGDVALWLLGTPPHGEPAPAVPSAAEEYWTPARLDAEAAKQSGKAPAPYQPRVGDRVVVTVPARVECVRDGVVLVETEEGHGEHDVTAKFWAWTTEVRPTTDEPGEVE